MKRSTRIGLGVGALAVGLAFAEVSAARADFSGTFRGPHGQFSIQIGSPGYPVGSYAPYGHRVYRRARYGYGFDTPSNYCRSHRVRHSHWIPVRRFKRRWVVVEHPIGTVDRGYDRYRGGYDPYYDDTRYRDRRYEDSNRYEKRRHVHSRSCRHGDDDWRD